MPKKHVAIYIRVSTVHQTTDSQKAELERWAEAQAGKEVRWYEDKASGKSMDRAGWNELYEQMQQGQVSELCCWRLDRLGRTASGLTKLFEELQAKSINLVSLRDGVDLSTAAGRLMANVIASVASYENEVRSERIRAGQQAARAKGKRWGGRRAGDRWKVTAEHIRHVHQARQNGTSVSEIARVLHLSRPTVYRIIEEDA